MRKEKTMTQDEKMKQMWDYLVETVTATDDERKLVTNIAGYTVETLEDVLYARTGYRSVEQLESE
jgi:hypothetical protein